MNKRIEELIDECTEWITGTIDGDIECFDKEKFTKLIVRECIAMADEFELEVNRSGLVDRMKERFGVEE